LFDRLFKWVLSIQHPLLASVLGGPNLAYTATFDPHETSRNIERIERDVFGLEGLEGMESRLGAGALAVLVRRSYAQYLGRVATLRYPSARYAHLLLHGAMLVLLIPYLLLKGARPPTSPGFARGVVVGGNEGARKLVEGAHHDQVTLDVCPLPGDYFGPKEVRFFLRAIRAHPRLLLCPPLLSNALRWLSKYAWIRKRYRPSELVVFAEGIPACSILTAYLREHGIRHVNHMHGERFSTPAQAFCCFDEMAVWGEAFRDLFMRQRWRVETVRISGTPFHERLFTELRGIPGHARVVLVIHTQFLVPGSRPFVALADMLRGLGDGWRAVFRPHYHQLAHGRGCFDALRRELPDFRIAWQDPGRTQLLDAIAEVNVVVGAYSTALLEAWIAGRKVIHLQGEITRDGLMPRYSGSPNVLFADEACDIAEFVSAPATDDSVERGRVNRLVCVAKLPSPDLATGKANGTECPGA
jgi:hypothetical protein